MIGETAPDFSLESTTGQPIRLTDLLGSFVVLIFYPVTDSPTCNKQLDEVNENWDDFLQVNARVFGVNTAKIEKQKEYCLRRRLQFPILSDPGGVVAKKYKAFMPLIPWNKRTVVAICPRGTVLFYERGKPEPSKVLQAIKKATANAASAG
jgi:thioredoxin-dependent peroxiredoxin